MKIGRASMTSEGIRQLAQKEGIGITTSRSLSVHGKQSVGLRSLPTRLPLEQKAFMQTNSCHNLVSKTTKMA